MSAQDAGPNILFRDARRRLFGSRQALADAVNQLVPDAYRVSDNDIGKIERGQVTWPRQPRRDAYRQTLQAATDPELGFFDRRAPQAEGAGSVTEVSSSPKISVPRLVSSSLSKDSALAAAASPHWEHQLLSGDPASAVDAGFGPADQFQIFDSPVGEWNSFSVVTSMLVQQRQNVAPSALLNLVEAHRECLSTLFRHPGSRPIRKEIGAMLGEASVVASRLWSAQGNRSMALAHCAYARRLADQLQHPRLGATARIFESNLHSDASTLIEANGDVMVGLRLLDEAAAASHLLSAPARARIAAEQAQTFAALGLRREADSALERAYEAAKEIEPDDRIGLYSDWSVNRVRVYEGTCRLLLRSPKQAIEVLESAVENLAEDQQHTNVMLAAQVDLASSYAETGEVEECCSLLGATYDRLIAVGNLRGIHRARQARRRLEAWNGERSIRQLDARMKTA
ncbi:XRE family transcriptional regulator [Actinoplanes sp. G11-F43]|uniref:XRE family transcriptional regulator n=1 Tax=Actinoplanes sp. G11-F43 TaxID=3424130 RepID=UPI003D33F170